ILRSQERHDVALRGAQTHALASPASSRAPTVPITPVPAPAAAPSRCDQRLLTVLAARLDLPESPAHIQLTCVLPDLVAPAAHFGAQSDGIPPFSLLAVFGIAPVEDAPRRAVHAPRAMLQAMGPAGDPSLQGLTGRCAIHVGRYPTASVGPTTGLGAQALDRA